MGDPGSTRAGLHRPSLALSLYSSKGEEGLRFEDVCVDIQDKRILWSVSAHAAPGHVLAVMGPSGSGKTTLLNSLAGDVAMSSGNVSLHGQKLTKKSKRKISYVLQSDLFFPNLTLRETLRYSALLRLPREMTFRQKLDKVEEIIETLHLQDCANTLIGNQLVRGLSGGEKKRANIGCELLTDPTLLLLDEPTSGLDSSSALSLLQVVTQLAKTEDKIVVSSVHQPSSQMFHMFDGLLLLAKGKVAYFGSASEALAYLASVGLRCTLSYNPADYLLEMVTQDESRKLLIGEDPDCTQRPAKLRWWQRCLGRARSGPQETKDITEPEILDYQHSPQFVRRSLPSCTNPLAIAARPVDPVPSSPPRKWPTPWYWQFLVLLVRTFRQSRHVILSKVLITQTLLITLVCSLVWFQAQDKEESIEDRYGLLFFALVFWGFSSWINVLHTFPAERTVIRKERSSGSYHLSAYYLAKTLSELPLVLMLPSFYFVVVYWASGINMVNAGAFFGSWFIMLLNSLTAQSLGLVVGAAVMDQPQALVISVVFMLSSLLVGGYYVKNLPSWLSWVQYLSFLNYSFDGLVLLVFTSDVRFACAPTSDYVECSNSTLVANTTTYIPGTAVVEKLGVKMPLYAIFLVLLTFVIIARLIAYLCLRFQHKI